MSKKITTLLIWFCILVIGLSACSSTENLTQAAPVEVETSASPTQAAETTQALVATSQTGTSQEVAYHLIETGQGNCYDGDGAVIDCPAEGEAFYGQDAQFTGNMFSFTDNGDGTIRDNVTGLIWQQTPDSSHFNWEEAANYCETLDLGGQTDWRMPSIKELYSISNFSTGWPYLNLDYFDLVTGGQDKSDQYWSSDTYVGVTVEGGSDAAFGVNHATGHIKVYPATVSGPMGKHVRCVYGDEYGINELVDNGDDTISDLATGLMWTQVDSGYGMDWEAALVYAQEMNEANYLGYSDWRLPDVKELQSLVDYSYAPGASDPANEGPAIDPMFSVSEIVNEAGDADYPYFWTSTSARFRAGGDFYYAWYVAFGRAVDGNGYDFHGAGAVRFDTKEEGGPSGEGGERYFNYVRLVRCGDVTETPEGDLLSDDTSIYAYAGSGPDKCSSAGDWRQRSGRPWRSGA